MQVYLADAVAAGVSVDAAVQVALTANTLRKISKSKRPTVTLSTCKSLLTHTLTCRHTCRHTRNTPETLMMMKLIIITTIMMIIVIVITWQCVVSGAD